MKPTRRRLLQAGAIFPAAASAASIKGLTASSPSPLYQSLGIKPVINGVGVVTVLGGSIMPPEVIRAMEEASRFFIPLPELEREVWCAHRGTAECSCRNGYLRCGLGNHGWYAAACPQGDPAKLRQLPTRDGIRYEVIQQKSHRSGYEHQMELCGAKIVTVETRQELETAIGERTGMLFFLNKAEHDGQIKSDEFVKIGKARGVPTMNDCRLRRDPERELMEVYEARIRPGDLLGRQSSARAAVERTSSWPQGPD